MAFRLSLRHICSEDGENRPLNEGDIEWQVKCAEKRRAVIRPGLQATLRVEMSISRPHENHKYMIQKKPFNSIFSFNRIIAQAVHVPQGTDVKQDLLVKDTDVKVWFI